MKQPRSKGNVSATGHRVYRLAELATAITRKYTSRWTKLVETIVMEGARVCVCTWKGWTRGWNSDGGRFVRRKKEREIMKKKRSAKRRRKEKRKRRTSGESEKGERKRMDEKGLKKERANVSCSVLDALSKLQCSFNFNSICGRDEGKPSSAKAKKVSPVVSFDEWRFVCSW